MGEPAMVSADKLRALLARVESASGPDCEIDCALFCAFAMPKEWCGSLIISHFRDLRGTYGYNTADGMRHLEAQTVPRYTSSTDAAIGLCEQVLPGIFYLLGKGKTRKDEPPYGAQLLFGIDEVISSAEHSASLPLALCAALLKAPIADPTPP